MKYGSVCSGIEAASCAWHPLGWRSEFLSEIEPFPSAVLAHYYPTVPNRGDMTKFKEWPDATLDLLVGGTPCQSFSVAGLRKGLADPRGNLMLTYLAIAERYAPRWLVWENVPGVLSSNGGRDFGTLLGGLAELGYGFAYRVLDAQYIRVESHSRAVPQRRRRVFVVGYLGDWRRAAAVLFERESLLGHPAPRREAGKGIAPTLSARTKGGGGLGTDFECDGGLVAHSLRGEGFDASEDGTGRGTPLVPVHAFDARQSDVLQYGPVAGPLDTGLPGATAMVGAAVRRLTPMECERLQGFPDLYTNIEFRGKPAADGPRYKALGNSMAVNVMRWIGDRIQMVENLTNKDAA
ncbi:DNA (cytosine-5-)-methyltransferase [Paraburkholderia sp. T12-10]|nr:DNA (cytosine-5-)-methyltransferase [Paraburkholderia sp. T12-10]